MNHKTDLEESLDHIINMISYNITTQKYSRAYKKASEAALVALVNFSTILNNSNNRKQIDGE